MGNRRHYLGVRALLRGMAFLAEVKKDDYRPGTAGWWLQQCGWTEVSQRKPKNGARPHPLWSKGDGPQITLSEAIKAEWERIRKERGDENAALSNEYATAE